MDRIDQIDDLDADVSALEQTIGTTRESLTVFGGELQNVRTGLSDASRDLGKLERGLSSGLRRAFDGVIFDGLKLSDALGVVAKSLVAQTDK